MSGPKSSRYTLTAEQLKKLLEEQERIRKELEEKARIERECLEAKEYLAEVYKQLKRYIEMIKGQQTELPSDGDIKDTNILQVFKQFFIDAQQLELLCRIEKNDYKSLMAAKIQAQKSFETIIKKSKDLIEESKHIVLRKNIQNDSIIHENIGISFANVGIYEAEKDSTISDTIIRLEELLVLNTSSKLKAEVLKVIEKYKSIREDSVRSNYLSITIEPLIKRCLEYDAFYKANYQSYIHMIDRYKALCQQLSEEEQVFAFNNDDLQKLKKTVLDYERLLSDRIEQEYISQSIDEVMLEMGYTVLGQRHVNKRSNKSFKSKMLTYENGTVVNITESSDGQITMEVGRTDSVDRPPDPNEKVALQKSMESFCNEFKVIEKKLSERGVVLGSRLFMAPPDEAYAQIINYTDYNLTAEGQVLIADKCIKTTTENKKTIRNG